MALRDSVIAAFAETEIQFRSGKEPFSLAGEIMDSLLTDTGFEKSDIDGMIVTPSVSAASTAFWAQSMVDFLGLELDFTDTCDLGGCGAAGSVVRAAAAIDAGLCSTVLVLCADAPSSRFDYVNYSFHEEWTDPYGLMGPPGSFGLLSKRYDHQYGLDLEVLAKLAITQRNHAILNDNACSKLRSPITVDDYMCSRMIADPIRLLDCVMFADGANGLLVTRRAIAKAKGLDRFVVPIGYGEVTNFGGAASQVDITATGHAKAGQRAFAQAGLTPDRIASFHPYDDFLIAIMLQFEMLGFGAPGQGGAFIRERNLAFDGDLPLNTGGGQISAGQAGLAGGGTNLVEAVRQLLGQGGARQVRNTDNALVTGIGWIPYGRNWGTSVALILAPDA
ncbi:MULTISPECIES: thiolase family protein [Sphingobium]|uniref:thiolase family protein n=1 Tax=Sphingobium TaxID=165695 RepID=UPI00159C8D23|nr:thiolase family protein [Sphingobium sp. 15-1]